MSIRFDAAADRLSDASAPLDYSNPYTVFFFFYLTSDPVAATAVLWTANRNSSSTYLDWLGVTNSSGIKFSVRSQSATGSTVIGSNTLSTATWYAGALVRSSDTSLQVYFMPVGVGGMTADALNTSSIAGRPAVQQEEIGGVTTSNVNPLSAAGGRVAGFKSWQAALSPAELELEAASLRPQRTDNLYRWSPLWPGDHLTDYSGNGRAWTEAGLTDEDSPPVGWHGLSAVLIPASTTYEQAIAGGITPAGALLRATNKFYVGGITPAGGLTRQAAKVFAGAVTPSGASVKTTGKVTDGAIEPAGALVKQATKILAGVVEPAGALVRQATKVLIGGLTPAGSLLRDTAKILAGALTPSGAVDSGRTLFQALAGSLTPAGVVLKQTALSVAGSLTPAGGITAVRVLFLALVGALTPSGALTTEAINTLVRLIEYVNGSFVALVNLAGRIISPALRGEFGRSDVEGEVEND